MGLVLGALGVFWGRFWSSGGRFGGTFGDLGTILDRFGSRSFFKTHFPNVRTLMFSILDRFCIDFGAVLDTKIEKTSKNDNKNQSRF